jgi:ADP-heptose:LPS heptosyltransferase
MRESLVIRSLPLDVAVDAVFRMADTCFGTEFDVLDYGEHAPVWREVAQRLGRRVNVRPRQRRLPIIGPWDLPTSTDPAEKYRNAYVLGTGPRSGLDHVMALARGAAERAIYFDVGTETIHSIASVSEVERIDTECRFLTEAAHPTSSADIDIRVIRVDLLGELVFTLPLLNLLKDFFPKKTLSLVVDRRFEEFARRIRAVDQVETLDIDNHGRFHADLRRCSSKSADWQLLPIGGGWRPDLASFIHHVLPAHHRISRLLPPSRRQEVVEVASLAMRLRYPDRTTDMVEATREYLRPLPLQNLFQIETPSPAIQALNLGEDDVLFAPLGGSAERDWTVSGWAHAAQLALEAIPGRLVLIGTDQPRHREFGAHLEHLVASPRLVNLTATTNLKDLLHLAADCGGYLGTNTAPMHLAALQGKRIVALNSPFESVDLWRYPFANQVLVPGTRLLHSGQQEDLASCVDRIWRRSTNRQTEDYFYSLEQVAEAVFTVFGRKPATRRQAS